MAASSAKKSTIVRLRVGAIRTLFAGLERLAPWLGGRIGYRLWLTLPPALVGEPLPAGGVPFTVTAQGSRGQGGHAVRGQSWGAGPVVYLVHGWGGLGNQFRSFVAPLVDAGYRVVLFDGPAHGESDPGPSGRGHSHGVELAHAIGAVVMRFGPAHAVVAHSMGAMSTMLVTHLDVDRLVLVAPMDRLSAALEMFERVVRLGPRTRRQIERRAEAVIGFPVEKFDLARLMLDLPEMPIMVLHDVGDRMTPHASSVALAETRPDIALETVTGLGHNRILSDVAVINKVVDFLVRDSPPAHSPQRVPDHVQLGRS